VRHYTHKWGNFNYLNYRAFFIISSVFDRAFGYNKTVPLINISKLSPFLGIMPQSKWRKKT
jgi:hypothetical protein